MNGQTDVCRGIDTACKHSATRDGSDALRLPDVRANAYVCAVALNAKQKTGALANTNATTY